MPNFIERKWRDIVSRIADIYYLREASNTYTLGKDGNIVVDFNVRRIGLRKFDALTDDGVELYIIWLYVEKLLKYKRKIGSKVKDVFHSIDQHYMQFINGWNFYDDETKSLVKNGGWEVLNKKGNVYETYLSVTSFGDIDVGDVYLRTDTERTLISKNKKFDMNFNILNPFKRKPREFVFEIQIEGEVVSTYDLIKEQGIKELFPMNYIVPLSYITKENKVKKAKYRLKKLFKEMEKLIEEL